MGVAEGEWGWGGGNGEERYGEGSEWRGGGVFFCGSCRGKPYDVYSCRVVHDIIMELRKRRTL